MHIESFMIDGKYVLNHLWRTNNTYWCKTWINNEEHKAFRISKLEYEQRIKTIEDRQVNAAMKQLNITNEDLPRITEETIHNLKKELLQKIENDRSMGQCLSVDWKLDIAALGILQEVIYKRDFNMRE